MSISWSRPSLTAQAALLALNGALVASNVRGISSSIVVMDEVGRVKASLRMDGASDFTFQAATDKAFTAVNAGMPTAMWDSIIDGNAHAGIRLTSAISRLSMLPGGIPILAHGAVVGAVGVSGGTDEQDVEIAEAAVEALTDSADGSAGN